jgi:spermidine synthase
MSEMQKRNTDLWFSELQTPNMKLGLKISGILRNIQTDFQHLLVAETYEYGRILVLDGAVQLTERDEFCYHEMMAHVPLFAHEGPSRVLIVGGGDGGILRECLKHDRVKEVTLVDIDKEVVKASRDFFPDVSCSMDDERARILNMDALEFIKDHTNAFDVVIVDSTDPVDFAAGLFKSSFYRDVFNSLDEKGILVAQTESPFAEPELVRQAVEEMRTVFPKVSLYTGFMPTYPTGMWTYTAGSKYYDPSDVTDPSLKCDTRYYSHNIHKASFVLPPFVKDLLEGKRRVNSN